MVNKLNDRSALDNFVCLLSPFVLTAVIHEYDRQQCSTDYALYFA